MGFHWPLQRLLKVTETRERALKAELFALSRRIARSEEEILRRRRMLRMILTDLAETPLPERLGRQDVLMRCHKAEEAAIRRIQEQIDEWTTQRQERTADLAKLMAKIDTLKKMREEARKTYQRHLDRREESRASEIFQMGFARRTRNTVARQLA